MVTWERCGVEFPVGNLIKLYAGISCEKGLGSSPWFLIDLVSVFLLAPKLIKILLSFYCSLWYHYRVQTSVPFFCGQSMWRGSFRSSYSCSAYSYQGYAIIWKWGCYLVDKCIPAQRWVALTVCCWRSFSPTRDRRRTINLQRLGKFLGGCRLDWHFCISYLLLVYLVQNIHKLSLCISFFCYISQFPTIASPRNW